MGENEFDLFVIGAGSGGVRAARLAALTGQKVGVAEESRPGGTCVMRGCVPKKFLVYGAEYGAAMVEACGYGWQAENIYFDWPVLRDNIQAEVSRLSDIYKDILYRHQVQLFLQRAEFIDSHQLRLSDGRCVRAKRILIAVGGRPWRLPITGGDLAISSDEAFTLPELPQHMVIIGGGYIACEFAGIFTGLGVRTVQAYRGTALLNGFDSDVRVRAEIVQKKNKVEVCLNQSPQHISRNKTGYEINWQDGSKIKTDCVMMATGRRPHTQSLGLDKAGVECNSKGAIIVDDFSQTTQAHIYAIGDVTDRVNLTPVAIREAVAFVETVYNQNPSAFDHTNVASAVFMRPPVGVVGLTEDQARAQFSDIRVYEADFKPMACALSGSQQRCYMKMIVAGKEEKIVGVHIIGNEAAELIQLVGICVKAELSKAQFDATCAVHPTMAEELVTLNRREAG